MKKISTIVFLFCVMAVSAFAQIVDPRSPLENDPNVRFGKLDNGLTYYILHNDKPAQRAEFYFVANVGAIQESKAQDGLAHFQEHMALNGTKNLPGKMMLDYFQKIGVEFGRNINAGTGVEQTSYMLNNIPVTRQGIIDTAMMIMHDYCGFVTNDPVEVEKERGVIVEEWRTRRVANWRMHEKELPYLYGGSKYAECTLIGAKENLETFDPSEIVKFYKTWYRPDLEAIIVVGDIDVDAIENQLKKEFADLPVVANPVEKVMPTLPDNEQPVVGIITDPEAQVTTISVILKSDPLPAEMKPLGVAYLTDMMEGLISDMINERLSDVSKQPDAPFIYAEVGFGPLVRTKDAFQSQIMTKEGEGIKGFTAFMTELEKAKRYGFTDDEYERAKTNTLRALERAKDNADSRQNAQLVNPLMYNFLFGDPYMTPEYEYNLAKGYLSVIPLPQLNQVVAQSMEFGKNTIVIYKSVEKADLVHPTEAQFLSAMEAVKTAEIQAPVQESFDEPLIDPSVVLKGSAVKKTAQGPFSSTEWTLKNGIKVIVRPADYQKEQVLFNIENAGGRSLLEDKDILAVEDNIFQMYTMGSGVSKFPDTKLTKMLTGKVANATPFISNNSHGVSGSCSPKDFETMLQLAYLMYADPRFDEGEFQTNYSQIVAVLPNMEKTPNYIFQTEASKLLYNNSPRVFLLTSDMLPNFSFQTLEKVYRQLFGNAAGATVTILGNINADEIKPLVEKYIGSLPVGKKATKLVDRHIDLVKGVIDHPFDVEMATPKTTACLVLNGDMAYTAENKVKMSALNYILDLVYTESIREEEGGTYGVSSVGQIDPEPKGVFIQQVAFDTDPEKATKLIQLAKDGFAKIASEGPTQNQVNMAKENFLKNLPENRISNSYWRSCINNKVKWGVDMDANYESIVNGLTVESIRDFAKYILDQNNYITLRMNPKK